MTRPYSNRRKWDRDDLSLMKTALALDGPAIAAAIDREMRYLIGQIDVSSAIARKLDAVARRCEPGDQT